MILSRPVAVLAVLSLAACSSPGSDGDTAGSRPGQAAAGSDAHRANITVTAADGCVADRTSFAAGGITFHITNKDATAVTEIELLSGTRIVGEKENLPPGFEGEFAVTVPAGRYTLYCPNATPERRTLTVTGTSSGGGDETVTALLEQGTGEYAKYVSVQVGYLLAATKKLAAATKGGDLKEAQAAYAAARPFYEKIEPVAESFAIGKDSVDADIDAREGDVPAAQWRGFHVLEKSLFKTRIVRGTGPVADRLVADVARLQGLTAKLTYQPTELANGAQELLDEVAASKITGEEERYSRIDVLDVWFNVEGSQQAFAQLQPALARIDEALAAQIQQRFDALVRVVGRYRDTKDVSGFVRYDDLTTADKRTLANAVKAVQEPLSKVAGKIASHS